MKRVETPVFSVEVNPTFETVRIFAGSVGLKREPEEMFSPQMSIWTVDAEKGVSAQDWAVAQAKETGLKFEQRPVSAAGLSGTMTRVKDRLEDYETRKKVDWYRINAVMGTDSSETWVRATAMASADDLALIEADFLRLLGSIEIKAGGEDARQARIADAAEADAAFQTVMAKIEAAQELHDSLMPQGTLRNDQPVADVEARFDQALAAKDLGDKRDVLRALVLPTLSLTEAGEATAGEIGTSRIGGGPDLPDGVAWPRDESGFHLNFLAQIDLADLPEHGEPLPADGLLSFFSGTDYTDWTVLYSPAGAQLVPHDLADDAEEVAIDAHRMVTWSSEHDRFVADTDSAGDLTVETAASGLMVFKRDGEPIVVLASEYEIGRSCQSIRFEQSLTVPFGLPGEIPDAYRKAGLEDPSDFWEPIGEVFKVSDGPQHQMFGVTGVRELSNLQELAAEHAAKQGWDATRDPDDWFILLKLASGGEVDFSFSDHGDYIFMANRKNTQKGDFSKIYALVESA